MPTFYLLAGTINTHQIYTLAFHVSSDFPPGLHVAHRSNAVGSHSWLHLSTNKKVLYATAWTEPSSLVAYAIKAPNEIRKINAVRTAARSGYVTASEVAVYSVGGGSGEVFAVDQATGGFKESTSSGDGNGAVQVLNFVEDVPQRDDGSIMDFGGLRHGAHSVDLSPDEKALYVADMGRNCIFTYSINPSDGKLTLGEKHISPRSHDGPRHTWPHPSGKYLYCVQEHSSMVDVFEVDESRVKLNHVQGVRIIPPDADEKKFWADEVRLSLANGTKPKYLFASTRGLERSTKGYVAAFKLTEEGSIDGKGGRLEETPGLISIWETPTSGGWANAIQPGPTVDGIEYIALTDSEEDSVTILSWNGQAFNEVARAHLDEGAGAATAVWL